MYNIKNLKAPENKAQSELQRQSIITYDLEYARPYQFEYALCIPADFRITQLGSKVLT